MTRLTPLANNPVGAHNAKRPLLVSSLDPPHLLVSPPANIAWIQHYCSLKTTCSECITAEPHCVWCKTMDTSLGHELRCGTMDKMTHCPRDDIVNPTYAFSMDRNRSLSRPKANVEDIVQLWPQKVTLKTRINSPNRFQVKFRQAEDYPVDLYFLMDMSYSMLDDKEKLASLGNLLGETMGKITSHFRLGFGSFVDKPVGPYVETSPGKLREPCMGCAAPYGFINHMPLNEDVGEFVTRVRETKISGNSDTPEGAFDAMMQAIVCKPNIGWRNVSRKILLVATDAGFHFAGDGKLGGIVKPNDETCHLDSNGLYTESTNLDYPSISQINNQVVKNDINVIFATTAGEFDIYRSLNERIVSSYADQLTYNSDNIVDIIREQYNKISSTVELRDNAPNHVQVTYASKCLSGFTSETNKCHGLKVGTEVEFEVDITVLSCPANESDRLISFEISPVGLTEPLEVHLELMCECGCQQQEEMKSRHCNYLGTSECGICICPYGHTGQRCECDAKAMAETKDESPCTQTDSSVVCSGRGTCSCKQCMCHSTSEKRVYGQYCECDDVSCPMHDGFICGGRGKCDCGSCRCLPRWTGDHCECDTSTKNCKSSEGVLCSNNGRCVCGECRCKEEFVGQVCEKAKAREARCNEYKECAHCFGFQEPIGAMDCSECARSLQTFLLVEKAEVIGLNETRISRCGFKDKDGCNFYFAYIGYDGLDISLPILVQETKECPDRYTVMIAIAVGPSIASIGLAVLFIWKITITMHDNRVYAKFRKDRHQVKWQRAQDGTNRDRVQFQMIVPSTSDAFRSHSIDRSGALQAEPAEIDGYLIPNEKVIMKTRRSSERDSDLSLAQNHIYETIDEELYHDVHDPSVYTPTYTVLF